MRMGRQSDNELPISVPLSIFILEDLLGSSMGSAAHSRLSNW